MNATDVEMVDERVRWNDIRRVGPLLLVVLAGVLLLSPQFAPASSSVGGAGCFDEVVVAFVDDCCPDVLAAGTFLPTDCDDPVTETPVTETPDATVQPTVRPAANIDVPDPIIGPIWLGATTVQVDDGTAVLRVPGMLVRFIDDNAVKVYDADGRMVYEGAVSASGRIIIAEAGPAPHTMVTYLKTGAKYTEVVGSVGTTG